MSKYDNIRYIRRVKGGKWQGRVWLGHAYGHLNLGLYEEKIEAWNAVRAYLNRGELPEDLLPKYVRRADGELFTGWAMIRGRRIRIGLFFFPEPAHRAMLRAIKRRFPRGISRRPLRRRRRPEAIPV